MLAACLTVLCLAQSVAESAPLDGLIERADRIVIARVAALHPLEGRTLQLVELTLEQEVYAAGGERLFAFPYATKYSKVPDALELGQSYVFFLELWSGSPFTETQAAAVEPLLQGAPLYSWRAIWKVDRERVTVPKGTLPLVDAPRGVMPGPNEDDVPREELLAWLAQRIERSLPTIRVGHYTGGPSPWEFRIAPDGSIEGRGASKARLEAFDWKALFERLEQERFDELPKGVGASWGPCSPSSVIEVRTGKGRKRVCIHGDYLERLTPAERDAAERALRVWRALPLSEPVYAEAKK
ncbi:MAG: hypothetical protein HOP15_11530 [Planctomycetes bacterium]|nr:hypothetical protein [Planctomycetota bacterium]